jgi:group I intron endonuclease
MSGISGVYRIRNKVNNHIYIGSSTDVYHRKRNHKAKLRLGTSDHTLLQEAVNEFGLNNFKFKVLLICDPDMLLYYEQACIDKFKPEYNMCPNAESSRGIKRSEEFRRKTSESKMGNKNWEGRKHTEETKKKLSEAKKGNKYGIGNKSHTGQIPWNKDLKYSEETRKKMSGRKHSEETKQKMCRRKHSEESKRKMAEAQKKRFATQGMPEESKRKMSEAQKKRFAAQRQSTDE